jgi:hypothetical protein
MSEKAAVLDKQSAKLLLDVVETPSSTISGEVLAGHFSIEGETLQGLNLLSPDGFEALTTSGADHDDTPVTLVWNDEIGSYGYFSPAAGWVSPPPGNMSVYRADPSRFILYTLSHLHLLNRNAATELMPNFTWDCGDVRLPNRSAPVSIWFARRLSDPEMSPKVCDLLRRRPSERTRIILTSTPSNRLAQQSMEGSAVVCVSDVGECDNPLIADPERLALRISGTPAPSNLPVTISGEGRTITVSGKTYNFKGSKQCAVIRFLYDRYMINSPKCSVAEVLDTAGFSDSVNSLTKAFSGNKDWRKIIKQANGVCWIEP